MKRISSADAVSYQRQHAPLVSRRNGYQSLKTVAGIDAGFPDNGKTTRVAVVVMDAQAQEVLESVVVELPTVFPYIPGLLSFREVPAMQEAIGRLRITPDIVLVDGQGIAHPRRFGSASHLGVSLGLATIGVGKSRLCGEHEAVAKQRGSRVDLRHRGELIGKVVRTRTGVKPVYVSVGHAVNLRSAVRVVLTTAWRFRLPEPIRHADRLASRRSV